MIRARLGAGRPGRAPLLGVAAASLLGAILAAGPTATAGADTPRQVLRLRFLDERARDAAQALEGLAAALGPARDAARRGAALVQSGDEPAAPALEEAAATLESATEEASTAAAAIETLAGVAAAARPGTDVPSVAGPAELRGIAGQLRDAAEAAGPFLDRRLAAARTLEHLESALAALDANDPSAALIALDQARSERSRLADWDPPPVTLPLWLRTSRRLIDAAEAIARAVLEGDAEAAERAGRRYAAAAEDARRADVSLALTLSETGDGLTATPLRRLATALADLERSRSVVASLMLDSR
jgi:hypothetical protein